jgi:hypothetical protein
MQPDSPHRQSNIQPGTPKTSVAPPNIYDFANVSHAKGDVRMITTTKDQILAYIAAGGSISSNFFALMVGCALTIFMALKSGGVEESWRGIFWLALYGSLILAAFFGFLTAKDEYRKYKYRKEIDSLPTTPLH